MKHGEIERRSSKARRWIALVAACMVVSLAGCDGGGGEENDGGESGGELTKQQVIARIDSLCEQAREQAGALEQPQSLPEAADLLREFASIADPLLEDIEEVDAPDEGKAAYDEWLARAKEATRTVKEAAAAAQDGDQAEFQRLASEIAEINAAGDKAARRYGFKVCGSPDADAGPGTERLTPEIEPLTPEPFQPETESP